jgi:uncharacterized repeat protein (TIGR02543 family)
VGVVGKGRLRYALAAVAFGVFALAVVSAATARPAPKKPAKIVAKATCGTLTLKKGGSGMLKVKAAKGSMPVVSASLAGTKAKTRVRTITLVGKTSFSYKLAKKQGKAEKVRVLVSFKQGKVSKRVTIVCAVRIGSNEAIVNITVDGGGDGSITPVPGGSTCQSTRSPCARTYKPGKKVTLTAAPATNSTFEGWAGACKGKAKCTLTAQGVKKVVAKFVNKQFKVTIERGGEGNGKISSDPAVTCADTCTATVDAGTIVRLKAEADGSSTWVGWTGECTSTSTVCNFPVDGDITVTATFDRKGNRLNVSRSSAGANGGTIEADVPGIDCGDTCSYTYPAGTVVTLTASAQPGYLFAGWFGDCASAGASTTCTVTMNDGKFAAADFKKGVPVSVAVSGTGTITSKAAGISCGATCSNLFFPSTVVTLTASGGTFDHWSDSCPAIAGNECTVATDPTSPPPTVTAYFK